MARNYTLTQTGAEVQDDLNKIEGARIEGGTITIDGVSITPVTTETDPTVPDWAKTPTKPEYTAEEVGALPEDTTLAELPTDASHRTVTDTEKTTWNAKSDFSGDYRDLTHQPDLSQFVTRTVNNLLYYYRKGEVYNREEITQLLSTITTGVWQVVPELPVASEATYGMKIYLVPSSQPQSGNVKDEYITVKNGNVYSWEQIGSTAIDLSDYVTDEDLQDALEDYVSSEAFQQALAGKQDTLVSGTNIKTVNGENILGSGNIVAGDPNAVKYTEQTLTDAQKAQARTNIGAGTYSKPSGGIPGSDIADGVIPDVSQFITKSVNDLVNYYLKTETYTQTEVNALIGAINQFHYEIAASTSAVTNPQANVLYLIGPTGSGSDRYEEYVYANSTWTKIGDTSIDLSGYQTLLSSSNKLNPAYITTDTNHLWWTNSLSSSLAGKAENNSVVHLEGNETIEGLKTFESGIIIEEGQVLRFNREYDDEDAAISISVGGTESSYIGWLELSNAYDEVPVGIKNVATPTANNDAANKSYVDSGLSGKQDTISDLSDIRIGASAGATAYQKPSGGIPAADIASGVIPSVPVQDVTVGGSSVLSGTTAVIPAIPDAVTANPTVPSGTTPTSLTGLQIGTGYYSISAGGGGTVTDVTVGGTSVVNGSGVAVVPAIPTVEALTTAEIDTIWANAS